MSKVNVLLYLAITTNLSTICMEPPTADNGHQPAGVGRARRELDRCMRGVEHCCRCIGRTATRWAPYAATAAGAAIITYVASNKDCPLCICDCSFALR